MKMDKFSKQESNGTASSSSGGFTLIELLAVVAILATLIGLLFPAYQTSMRSAKGAACLGNMKSYGQATQLYIAEYGGLPWWDGASTSTYTRGEQAPGSTYPNFASWVNPYLLGKDGKAINLRCPLGNAADWKKGPYGFNYSGNTSLCFAYPKVMTIPLPHSRVILAAEAIDPGGWGRSGHLNQAMWGISAGAGENRTNGVKEFLPMKDTDTRWRSQGHGTKERPGLHCFFLDGHAALVRPTDGNWFKSPIYAGLKRFYSGEGGLFYDRGQFNGIKAGNEYSW